MILIVWFAGYSTGVVLIEHTHRKQYWVRHLNNEFLEHNNTLLIDRVDRHYQMFYCPQPTSTQLHMVSFDIKIPGRPVGSSKIGMILMRTFRPLGYERVYLPLWKVADTPFHIQGDVLKTVYLVLVVMNTLLYIL